MAPNARQRRRYSRTGDIWRPSQTITAGAPSATSYTQVLPGIAWGALYTPNIDQVSDFGPFKAFTDLVLDGICIEASQVILDNDVLVDTTYLLDGSRSRFYGQGLRLRGEPQLAETTIRGRNPNAQNFKAMSIDHLPTAIALAYA